MHFEIGTRFGIDAISSYGPGLGSRLVQVKDKRWNLDDFELGTRLWI